MQKVKWGILSTAKIGTKKVIPALQRGKFCEVAAIASRDPAKAKAAAAKLRIPKSYGSYTELLADPDIDAVYNPLPNHMHVPWSLKAIKAGKNVLCEKPIGLSSEEGRKLVETAAQHPELKVMEAFMYRLHPQWKKARELVEKGKIGTLKTIQSFFSYHNTDGDDIRNKPEMGGGGLMDIGCYSISLSRFIFGSEPERVLGCIEQDPEFNVDRMVSGILDFGNGTSTFSCSTQLTLYQRVNIFGTEGRVEIQIPFNASPDRPCIIWHQRGDTVREMALEICDQYTIQGDLFAQAVMHKTEVPTPLEDAVANMKVIEAINKSAQNGTWVCMER
jgi:predicted dehydrogenase